MSQADLIRAFVIDKIAQPMRSAGYVRFLVRAGDVHREMGLRNAMPSVCSAIGSNIFETVAGVSLVKREGPHAGSNALFEFEFVAEPRWDLNKSEIKETASVEAVRSKSGTTALRYGHVDFTDAICLVSCVKTKRAASSAARELYVSPWFIGARNLVESSGAQWFVLSALYGLVPPDKVIQPYDHTLNDQGVEVRRAWADDVLRDFLPLARGYNRVVIFAGQKYREFLVGPLRQAGFKVDVPMSGLRQGEQLSWLSSAK